MTGLLAPHSPKRSRPFDREAAATYLRRVAFAPSLREIDEAVRLGPAALAERLVRGGGDGDESGRASESDALGINFLIATAVLVPAVILLGFKLLPHSPVAKHLVVGGFSFEDGAGIDRRDLELTGKEGVVTSPLRPAGTARIDDRRVDVVTRGEMLDVDTRVRVIEVRGNRVVVAPVEATPDNTPDAAPA